MVNFLFAHEPLNISFDPSDSDLWENTVILENTVGTLVKYNSSGNYSMQFADSWSVSPDGLKWSFKFKKELYTENGEKINADSFKKSLIRLLNIYNKKGAVPVFSDLFGWDNYKTNGDVTKLGINVVNENELEFVFTKRINGFLEYLSMPYYGFYVLDDFDSAGKWKNRKKVTSTGAYKITSFTDKEIIIEARGNWYDFNNIEVKKARYTSKKFLNDDIKAKSIYVHASEKAFDENVFKFVRGIPSILCPLILNPDKDNVFNDIKIRQLFLNEFRNYQSKNKIDSKLSQLFTTFYPIHDKYIYPLAPSSIKSIKQKNKIKIGLMYKVTEYENKFLTKFFEMFFKKYNLDYEILVLDRTKPKSQELFDSMKYFDIKYGSVDIGGNIENWIIDMIFCSKMGVRYPDPSKRICNLTARYGDGKLIDESYIKEFNTILAEDASVIPVIHTSTAWLVSKDIDLSKFGNTISIPRMDEIRFVK